MKQVAVGMYKSIRRLGGRNAIHRPSSSSMTQLLRSEKDHPWEHSHSRTSHHWSPGGERRIKRKCHVIFKIRVQGLCESRGGHPGLPVLMSLMVSVDVKQHWTTHTHWSQFVPNMSTDIRGHEALHHHHHQSLKWSQRPSSTRPKTETVSYIIFEILRKLLRDGVDDMSFLHCLAIDYSIPHDLELFTSPLSLSEHGFIQTQTNVYLENTTGHFDAIVNIINLPHAGEIAHFIPQHTNM